MEYYSGIIGVILIVIFTYFFGLRSRKENVPMCVARNDTDALRGIAILTVITHHMVQAMPSPGILLPYKGLGYLSVAVFFMLSGYGLTEQYKKNRNTYIHYFWKRRIISIIIPVLVIRIILYFLYDCIIMQEMFSLQNMCSYIIGEWYIKMLLVWYVFYGCVFALVKNDDSKIIVLFICSIAVCIFCICKGMFKTWYDTSFCFPIGVCWSICYEKIVRGIKRRQYVCTIVFFITCAICAGASFTKTDVFSNLLRTCSAILFCGVVICIMTYVDFSKNVVARFLGRMSLSIFLSNSFVMAICQFGQSFTFAKVIIYYALHVVLGICFQYVFSKTKRLQ